MLVINALSANDGGGKSYIKRLITYLNQSNQSKNNCVVLANPSNFHFFQSTLDANSNTKVYCINVHSFLWRTVWEIFFLPSLLSRLNSTHYFAPGGIMLTIFPLKVQKATALRNMLPFSRYGQISKSGILHGVKNFVLKNIFKLSYYLSDKIIFISKSSQELITKKSSILMKKSTVINHGFDKTPNDLTAVHCLNYEVDKDFFLYASSFFNYKNHAYVVEEFSKYVNSGGKSNLLFVGSHLDSDYGRFIEKLISSKDLNDRIRILTDLPQRELFFLYRQALAFIYASSCECCPNILIEKLHFNKTIFCNLEDPMPEFGTSNVNYFNIQEEDSLSNLLISFGKSDNIVMPDPSSLSFDKWNVVFDKTLSFIYS